MNTVFAIFTHKLFWQVHMFDKEKQDYQKKKKQQRRHISGNYGGITVETHLRREEELQNTGFQKQEL